MKNNSLIFYIISIIITIVIILLILFNTIFYDYKGKLNNYLNNYYSETNNNIDNINNLINRYKNNTNRTTTISEMIENDLNNRVSDFNTSYDNIDILSNKKDILIDKFIYFFDNISDSILLINNKETLTNNIISIYESKVNYLTALNYFNEGNYNDAYNYFLNVIQKDSYYEDTTSKIDEMFNNEINELEEEINELLIIPDNASNNDKLEIYKKALEYLINKKKELAFDISKSKSFNNQKQDINNNLNDIYESIAKDYEESNKYNEAIKTLNDGINFLNDYELDATKLIELKDEYSKMEPISLTTLEGVIEGSSIKEELATFDINNNNYARSLSFYKVNKTTISYNLNDDYKYLTATINIAKDVTTKNKNYGRIRIYGDDKKIYDSNDLTTKFKKKDIKLNINNIKNLKVEYTISNSKSINKDNINVAVLGNPTLEKY